MNSRIQELKNQCWVEKHWDKENQRWIDRHIDLDKFAHLLLEDVMQTLFITGHESAVDELNKHFGVEQ